MWAPGFLVIDNRSLFIFSPHNSLTYLLLRLLAHWNLPDVILY
jgi:hypothetical protein